MKKVLLITPEFFQYYKYISNELCNQGCSVERFRDIPSTSTLMRGLSRLNRKFIQPAVSKYMNEIIAKAKDEQFDTVIIVYGMTFSFSPKMIEELKNALPEAIFTVYLWDSMKNLPGSQQIIDLFDNVYSFDRGDCTERIKFLPLFYHSKYKEIADKKQSVKEEYFCSYIGTAHPQKLKDINDMSALLKEKYPNQFIYHYIPSKLKYYYHKLKDAEYKNIKLSDLAVEKLSPSQISEIFLKSKCILDAAQAGQTGLTMRTFEVLGAKKKLITSNQTIKEYDFYNPTNIYIYSQGEKFDFSSDFFTKPYEELPEEIYEKYSLSSWVATLLS